MAASLDQDDDETEALINDELETLRAIYMDDIKIDFYDGDVPSRPRLITYVVEPATAHEKSNRYVSFTLELALKRDYPYSSPGIGVRNPRGLSDALVDRIYEQLRKQGEDGKGNPVLYELMETAKDFITEQKLPTCGCAICLCDFEERENEPDDFMRTECFHFFHIECLTRYVEYSLDEIGKDLEEKLKLNPHAEPDLVGCPVCRISLNGNLLSSLPPSVTEVTTKKSSSIGKKTDSRRNSNAGRRPRLSSGGWNSLPPDIRRKLDEERKIREVVFRKQKAKGAIIDLEEEKSKYKLTFAAKDDGDETDEGDRRHAEDDAYRDDALTRDDNGSKGALSSVTSVPLVGAKHENAHRRNRRIRGKNDHGRREKHWQDKVVYHKRDDFVVSVDDALEASKPEIGLSNHPIHAPELVPETSACCDSLPLLPPAVDAPDFERDASHLRLTSRDQTPVDIVADREYPCSRHFDQSENSGAFQRGGGSAGRGRGRGWRGGGGDRGGWRGRGGGGRGGNGGGWGRGHGYRGGSSRGRGGVKGEGWSAGD